MSISSDNRIAGPFTGTGAIVPYAFTFKVFNTSDVVATVTDLDGEESTWVETTNYVVALNPDQEVSPGGTLTPVLALDIDYKLTLTSAVANLQPVVLTNAGAFLPAVINTALDRLTILVQQLAAKLAYTITFPYSDGAVNGRLPTKALRANTTLGFDANGDMIAGAASSVAVSTAMTPVVQAATLAAGRTAFGVDPAVTSLLTAAPALADVVGFSDVSAADAMKKTTLGDVLALSTGGIRVVRVQKFTSSGTYTPHANMLYADMELWGAGGGGGGVSGVNSAAGGGGGAGGYAREVVTAATVGASQSVTIGTGGTAGSNTGGTGGTGGTTSVGALASATGGVGGVGSTNSTSSLGNGGLGGAGSGGDINATGAPGTFVVSNSVAGQSCSGMGGNSSLGGAGRSVTNTGGNGNDAVANSGSGASGALSGGSAQTGGVGGSGLVIITEYCSA